MKAVYVILILGIQSVGYSQTINHQVGLIPLSVFANKGFFYSHGVNYTISGLYNQLTINTEAAVFNKLDARKRHSDLKGADYVPFFNQSSIRYSRLIFNTSTKQSKVNRLFISVGYHYFQHGSQTVSDYWYLDSISNNGIKVISGFKTHSALIGVKWENIRSKLNENDQLVPGAKHTFSIFYLLGLDINLKGYDDYGTGTRSANIPNNFSFNRNGFKCKYQYERIVSEHIGLYGSLELFYAPFINYVPNKLLFIPRGGENITPLFPGIKIGLNIFGSP